MKLFLKNFFSALLLVIIYISCDDDPTSLGDDLLKGDGAQFLIINSTEESFPQSMRNYIDSDDTTFNLGTSQYLLVGKESNLRVSTLIRFSNFLSDSIKDAIEENDLNILNAHVEIKPKFFLGDTLAHFDFTVSEIISGWTSFGFNVDSLPALTKGASQIAFNKNLSSDTLYTFDLDVNLVNKWFQSGAGDSSLTNEGIILEPTPDSERIIGFKSNSLLNAPEDISALVVEVERPGQFVDTLRLNSLNDVHVVEGNEIPQDEDGNIYLQGGLPVRADFFMDLVAIPELIAINEATLEIFFDSTRSVYSSNPTDTLSVLIYSDSTAGVFFSRARLPLLRNQDGEAKYSGDILPALDLILNTETQNNEGFRISLGDDQRLVNRVALRGSNFADVNRRPKIIIKYTKLN